MLSSPFRSRFIGLAGSYFKQILPMAMLGFCGRFVYVLRDVDGRVFFVVELLRCKKGNIEARLISGCVLYRPIDRNGGTNL